MVATIRSNCSLTRFLSYGLLSSIKRISNPISTHDQFNKGTATFISRTAKHALSFSLFDAN